MDVVWFSGWDVIVRTLLAGTVTYVILITLLRITGPRTLAKWYAFDLIITVALGSTFANSVLSRDISVAQAVLFRLCAALQYAHDHGLTHGDVTPANVRVDVDGNVAIRMTLTAPGCPAAQILPGQVADAVKRVEGVADAKVEVVWEPGWTKDRMSDAAKLQLGMW